MKIALIANGESALKTRSRELIDSCDEVIRMGLFVTQGYEEYVGEKTTIYGTAKWKYIQRSANLKVWLVDDFNETYNNDLRNKLNYDKDIITQNKLFTSYRPSIGTRILHKALLDFKNSTIYVKGFDFLTTGHYFNKAHTYTNCSHPIFLEKCYYNRLVSSNTIYEI